MSELVVVTQHDVMPVNKGRSSPIDIERVVGIRGSNDSTILEYNYRNSGQEREEQLTLETKTADRITEFYEQCIAAPLNEKPAYDCFRFVWFALNEAAVLTKELQSLEYTVSGLTPSPMKAGQGYTVITRKNKHNHAVLGTNHPDHTLSVLGMYGRLAITSNKNLLSLYNGIALRGILAITQNEPT